MGLAWLVLCLQKNHKSHSQEKPQCVRKKGKSDELLMFPGLLLDNDKQTAKC